MTTDHDRLEDLVAAYVLDACEEDEREVVVAHVEACASCRELTRRLSGAASAVALSAQAVQPPDRLRARILHAAIAAPAATPPTPGRRRPRSLIGARPRLRVPFRLPRVSVPALSAAMAACAVTILGLAAWNLDLNQQLHQLSQPPQHYVITGTGAMAGSSGNVTALNRYGYTLVDFNGMPQLNQDQIYELWFIDPSGAAKPAKVFTPDSHGSAQIFVGRPLTGVRMLAVTIERGPDGVAAPSQNSQLEGDLA